jgi:hypothetical protein
MKSLNVFVAHSLTDRPWKDRLVAHLRSLDVLVSWTLDDIEPGQDWEQQIRRALSGAEVAILLISPAFLASEFIASVEIPALLKRREHEGLLILPVVIQACRWEDVPWLRTIQVRSLPDDLPDARSREQLLYAIVTQILRHASGSKYAGITGAAAEITDQRLIFISHHHDDREFARLLKKRIEKNKLKAWIDADRLEAGANWTDAIDHAIREAAAVVIVMTPKATQSQYVTYEWAYALGAGIRVIPVILKPTRLHSHMQRLQHIDFTKIASSRTSKLPWSELIRVIKEKG